jgi:hypothetical protein
MLTGRYPQEGGPIRAFDKAEGERETMSELKDEKA